MKPLTTTQFIHHINHPQDYYEDSDTIFRPNQLT